MDLIGLPDDKLRRYAHLMERAAEMRVAAEGKQDFMTYVQAVWPEFINGRHHKIMAEKFNRLATGELKRLIVNMPPRHTKSEFGSYLLPSWWMGRNPRAKIMQTTHTAELAYRFGRKVRNLMNSAEYVKVFEGVELRADSQAAGRWETSLGGEYFAAVGGS